MSDVKRWCENPVNGGPWVVLASDYDALRAERDEIARRADIDVIERNRIIAEKSAEVEALRDSIRAAFIAGCMAVHENHDPSDRHPDFSEAADDYLASIEDALEEKK